MKLMKGILANKKMLVEYEKMALTGKCIVILQKKLPPKFNDPGSFTILRTIGNSVIKRALCDLRASINLMPLSIFKRLELGEAKPTTMTL